MESLQYSKPSTKCKEFLHLRCCAHILNLVVSDGLEYCNLARYFGPVVVSDGLEYCKDSIDRICDAVKYVKASPARLENFKKCAEEEKISTKCLVCLHIPTRWNSTYMMLEAALKFQKAFERLEEQQESHFLHYLNDKRGISNENDWKNAHALVKFLKTFYDATLRFSGTLYVTSNSFFSQIVSIEYLLIEWSRSEDPHLIMMALKMKAKFDKYWGDVEKINMMLFMAVVLDPKYKLTYVKFSFSQIYELNVAIGMCKKVKDTLVRLFDNYSLWRRSSFCQISSEMKVDFVEGPLFVMTSRYKRYQEEKTGVDKSEVDMYLDDTDEKYTMKFDILDWWKINSSKYPILSQVTRDVLAMPISTVAYESVFSTSGRVLDVFRSSLTPRIVEALICAQDWLQASPIPIHVEESLEELEKFESELKV